MDQLCPPLQRRTAERSLSEGDALGMMMVAVLVGGAPDSGPAQRQPVLLGQEDRASVDVIQGDQSRRAASPWWCRTCPPRGSPWHAIARGGLPWWGQARPPQATPGHPWAHLPPRRFRCAGRPARPPARGWRRQAWTSRYGCAYAPFRAKAPGPRLSGPRCPRRRSSLRICRSRTERGAPWPSPRAARLLSSLNCPPSRGPPSCSTAKLDF